MSRLQEGRQVLASVLDQNFDLLQSVHGGVGLVLAVQGLQQGQIFARFGGNVLDRESFSGAELLASLEGGPQGRDVECDLGQNRQVRQGDTDPLCATSGGS